MFNIDLYTKNIGKEILYNDINYKVVGFYDNHRNLFYITMNLEDTMIIDVLTNIEYLDSNNIKLEEDKIINVIESEFNDAYRVENKKYIYLKKYFDKPLKLTYIFTKERILKFDSNISLSYDSSSDLYRYKNKDYNIEIENENVYEIYSKIKKAYIEMYFQMMNGKMDNKTRIKFMKEFLFCMEYE